MPYKIESRQRHVAGLGGHNYLALVDESGIVKEQIHGYLGSNGRLVLRQDIGNPEVEGAAREVVSGPQDEIMRIWSLMQDDARDLGGDPELPGSHDNAKAMYGLLGPNSNSFWATILRRAGFDYHDFEPDSPNWTPGTGINLSNPVWWSPEHRWPGTIMMNPERSDRAQLSFLQIPPPQGRGLLSLMDDEDTLKNRPFGLLSYMDREDRDESHAS